MQSYIFYTILIIFILVISVVVYIINNKYKRLSKKEKQSLEKSLKKMGFFILIILLLPIAYGEESYFSEDRGMYPIVIPANSLLPAEEKFEEITYDAQILLDETVWRLGIGSFLDDTNRTVIYNNTTTTNTTESLYHEIRTDRMESNGIFT